MIKQCSLGVVWSVALEGYYIPLPYITIFLAFDIKQKKYKSLEGFAIP